MTRSPFVRARLARLAPPSELTVSQWADSERRLPAGSGPEPGQWHTDREPYQRALMDAAHEGAETIVIMASAQSGKALAIDTPIATPDGWRSMGELKAGDEVFDERGQRCTVIIAAEIIYGRLCFRVRFSDGSMIVADGEHRWSVESDTALRPGDSWRGPGLRIGLLTTAQIAASCHYGHRQRNRYAIPVARALDLDAQDLPVDPYVLGVWLGDGNTCSAQITQHESDVEILDHLRATGVDPVVKRRTSTGTLTVALEVITRGPVCTRGHDSRLLGRTKRGYCAECARQYAKAHSSGKLMDPVVVPHDGIARRLATLGLLRGTKRPGNFKHIPLRYLRASFEQRLALLQGLMDTDGHCSKVGACEISSSLPALRNGVLDLLVSLGLKPTSAERPPIDIPAPQRGRVYRSAPYSRISFIAYRDLPVFRLSRKLARQPSREGRRTTETGRRRIVAVEPTESVPVRCIAVDSPSHLYLAGRGMIPTHNTEMLLNTIGYFIASDPAPILLVEPTESLAKRISKNRLGPMLRDTPALKARIADGRGRKSANTLLHKKFPGGHLALAGANSPTPLSSDPIRIVLADEIDKYPPHLGDEGDPLALALKRTTRFWNRLHVLASTPTVKGSSRIESWFLQSDQRRYFVPCPRCQHRHVLEWRNVKYTNHDPETAHLVCPECHGRIEDHERARMIAAGEWRPTAVSATGIIGFHLWEAYSSTGTLSRIVRNWLRAQTRGREALREFINQTLGETWEEYAERVEPHALIARAEDYGEGVEVPAGASCLTAGIDTQDDRFEMLVVAWGRDEERWVVDWRTITGDPKQPETREALRQALERKYQHASGQQLPIHAACIDSGGHRTDEVYDFVLAHQHKRLYATKGMAGAVGHPLVGAPSERRWGRSQRPVRLYPINTDDAKTRIMEALNVTSPGRGYFHLPANVESVDDEFAAQLTAEQRVPRYHARTKIKYWVWEQIRERNEGLDCACLSLCARHILRPNIQAMAEMITKAAGLAQERPQAPPVERALPPPAPPAPVGPAPRRVARSAYLGRA